VSLQSELLTSSSNKSSWIQPFEPEGELDPMPLESELATSLSNKSSSMQPFMLTLPDEYDPFQVFLTKNIL